MYSGFSGGVGGNRTPDTKIFSLLLYQLSYRTILLGLQIYCFYYFVQKKCEKSSFLKHMGCRFFFL